MDDPPLRTRLRRTRRVLRVGAAILFAVLLVGSSAEAVMGSRARRNHPPPGTMVSAGSYSLHVDCRGSGSPAVVFESGSGGTSLDWAAVQPEIAKHVRACSYDRAGYGWSDAAPEHTLGRMRHDLGTILEAVGPPPYVLVAHSFGGLLALDYTTRHPERVVGLVLVDAADKAVYQEMRQRFPTLERNGNRVATLTRVASVLTRFGVTRLINQPATPRTMVSSVRDEYRALGFSPKAYRAFSDDLRAFPGYVDAAQDDVQAIPSAVLAHDDPGTMWQGAPSDEAEEVWQEHQRALATRLGTRLQIVPSTHFIQVVQPGAVIEAIGGVMPTVR